MTAFKFITVAALLSLALPALAQTYPYYPSYPSYPATAPVYSTCPNLTLNLWRGLSDRQTSGQVSQLQQFLAQRYGNQGVTGYFGMQTYGNVVRLQQEQAVYPVTGGVGPLTRAAIARVCGGTPTPVPTQNFSASPTSGAAPLAVTFSINNTMGEDTTRLYVDFGDGQNAKPQQIYCFAYPCNPAMTLQHTYQSKGTYTARLMRDNNYCPPGMYCTLMYREPTELGRVTIVAQ